MAAFTQTELGIYVDGLAVSGYANAFELTATADELDFTTYASGKWRTKKVGMATHSANVAGFQDHALLGLDPSLPITSLGGRNTITVSVPGTAVADPAFMCQGIMADHSPLNGEVGKQAMFGFDWTGDAQLVRGQLLHPVAARTTTAFGTAATFTAPTATQTLYAAFHVFAVSGTGSIVFTVQTDDNVGFTTPTTRITSQSFTGLGGQFASLAGALTGETHVRVGWTITGFTSVTFTAAAGVL